MNIYLIIDYINLYFRLKSKPDLRANLSIQNIFFEFNKYKINELILNPFNRYVDELSKKGFIKRKYNIIKLNHSRCRVVAKFKNINDDNYLVFKWINLDIPFSFNFKSDINNEVFMHKEISSKLGEFIPKCIFHDKQSIAIEFIDGIPLREILLSRDTNMIENTVDDILRIIIKTHKLTKNDVVSNYEINSYLIREFNYMINIKRPILLKEIFHILKSNIQFNSFYNKYTNQIYKVLINRRSPWIKSLCYLDLDLDNLLYCKDSNKTWLIDTEDAYFGLNIFDLAWFASRLYLSIDPILYYELLNNKFIKAIIEIDKDEFISSIKLFNGLCGLYLILGIMNPTIIPFSYNELNKLLKMNNNNKVNNNWLKQIQDVLIKIDNFDYINILKSNNIEN